ncbi:hypothetical protein FOTG_17942 [Fusarium oxysporum f. sp. vasinfectum 25433]|uniref:Uncharacterized protein n=1 Tax=Fusarium oxysporum f. sp. vasinfectum 25433 TaxID=1089449 RepID=X0KY56_FUSOX|nr:hypothetical protein FOTG_17942 [Fusarium oxysporum f. sp. vasinfectum 25433]
MHEMGKQMVEIKDQMAEELQRIHEQVETVAANVTDGDPNDPAPLNSADVFYCTIDVSRLEEEEARFSAAVIGMVCKAKMG